jgi:hypothetical protein
MYLSNTSSVGFFTDDVSPNQGEIYLWYDTGSILDTGQGSSPSGPSSGFEAG